jgi:hypothetical protein
MDKDVHMVHKTGGEAGKDDRRVYQPPTLVCHGPLFLNTQATTCSELAQSLDPPHKCNPPDGDFFGDIADLSQGEGLGGSDADHDRDTQADGF